MTTAQLPGIGGGGFDAFSSPADKSVREQKPALSGARSTVSGARPALSGTRNSAATPATGKTIYAYVFNGKCAADTGTGAQNAPFCLLQDAVNAAQPGDTIDLQGYVGSSDWESVTIKTSGISIVGIGDQAWVNGGAGPALIFDHVSNVTVSNLMLYSNDLTPAVEVVGSSGVTLDSSYLSAYTKNTTSTVTIDGASSGVAITRSYLDTGSQGGNTTAVSVAAGAGTVTLAGDVLAGGGIVATGVKGLNVTGNTVQRGCKAAIDIEGGSSAVNLENNVLEDANPTTDQVLGGYQSQCASNNQGWAPDVTVSADSTTVTADYNDFYVYGTDATAPYSWAGTTYPTLDGFKAATSQGAHDLTETKAPTSVFFRLNTSVDVDARPQPGSAAIGSANPAAPGRLGSDFYGTTPYTDRGAIQYAPDLTVAVTGEHTSAFGVSLSANVTSASGALNVHVDWGDGSSGDANAAATNPVALSHTYAKLGSYPIVVTATDRAGYSVSNSLTAVTAGSEYVAFGPTRLLDSRDGSGTPKVGGFSTTRVQVAGANGIPAGATAAVLNVTVTDSTGAGHVTVYADGSPSVPTTSNVNYTAGQTVPNMVVAQVGAGGYVDLQNAGAPLDLVVDITGYFVRSPAAGYTPLSPSRLVDTRFGTGAPQSPVDAGQSLPVQIAGAAGGQLPASGITAVALNVTVTNPGTAGHLTVYPGGQQAPNASNLNFTAGQTVANSVVVPVGPDGTVRVLNAAGSSSDVIVDVVGYYGPGGRSAYLPLAPTRLLDTRDTTTWQYGPVSPWSYVYMPMSSGRPDITAFALNATVTDTVSDGHLSVAPDPNTLAAYQGKYASTLSPPSVSSLNWTAGETVPNLVQAPTGANGLIDFWNVADGTSNLIVDVFGFYQND
ncbi:right-handed parallel beta-helix repeat-containing protein [Streptomyces sp. CBMA123]|uniref:right-handed parallel beta-helix repeat-containing protein n=1 Tax=Streptomyces sp. CBMA123 TaxID=1896313 RepID=UPI0016620745|nr:right-handed parallel beta-helix repeat-containing protein [Streptomyces sp. CBMA123]MBD0689491.1 hypothetical protein [Streptomyces sp. CBMA123]